MGWKKRAKEHIMLARNALDNADELITSDVASRNRVDVLVKHVSKGFVATALALAEAYGSLDVEGKRAMRMWVGDDVVDVVVALHISRSIKKEAA